MIVILTAGPDTPGVNAFLYCFGALANLAHQDVVYVQHGFDGLIKSSFTRLHIEDLEGNVFHGASQVGSSNSLNLKKSTPETVWNIVDNLEKIGTTVLIVLGDQNSHHTAEAVSKLNIPVICVPCTPFNDVPASWYSIGCHTCMHETYMAIRKYRTIADSNDQIILLEVSGDFAGHITVNAGIAALVDYVVTYENPKKCQELIDIIRDIKNHCPNKKSILIIFSEKIYGDTCGYNLPSLKEVSAQLTIQTNKICRVAYISDAHLGAEALPADLVIANGFANYVHEQIKDKNLNISVGYDGWNYYYSDLLEANSIEKRSQTDLVNQHNKLYKITRQH